MSHREYVPGVVTTPALLREVVGLLRDGVEEVIVGESNGFSYSCQKAFEKTRIETALEEAGGTVVNLSEHKLVKVKIEKGITLKDLLLLKQCLKPMPSSTWG